MGASVEELETVYRERYPEFLRIATAICGSVETARDAVNDAFVGLIVSRRRYRRNAELGPWVWRAVVNASRKQRLRVDHTAIRRDGASTDAVPETDNAVRAAVARLPERQRLVLFLRYYADLDYAAIAEALSIAPGTVAAALHAAHETLRRDLEEVHLNART